MPHEDAASEGYENFWRSLREGKYQSSVYRRIGKGGREVWINASYNPIFDMNGRPFKVVKFASDIMATIGMTEATNRNIQSVAAATEEFSASINEISKNMDLSKRATDEIVEKTGLSGEAVKNLVNGMQSMGDIAQLIRDIADQVNLLALNATIEAARAGDAGKGFAVVASEVKNLANQTAQATDRIANEIQSIQSIAKEVEASVGGIITAANNVNHYVSNVASSIQEQSAVTQDISANIQRSSDAVSEIEASVKRVG